ncbi:DUF1189 domain-containing protein [Salipaludibacillus neizhouensis]|nr:DUF1189 domain-containing protein [Salipaludibacillus neizhouensis]
MNIFKQFISSLHSPETIAKFRMQKIGKTILYVFFLMLITSIPFSIQLGANVNNLYTYVSTNVEESIPDFSVENGILKSDVEEPIITENDNTVIIFDPTGELTPLDLNEYQTAFALLDREAVLVIEGNPQPVSYQDLGTDISKAELSEHIETFGGLLPLIIGVMIVGLYLFTTALKFIGIFTLSVITLLLKRKTANQLNFKQGWVLSAYAVTLPTIIFAVFDAIGLNIPFSFAIYWVIAIVMINLVLRNIPKPKQKPISDKPSDPQQPQI